MSIGGHYGAKRDDYDYRDWKKQYCHEDIPHHPNVDLSNYVVHVYNQGQLGSCTANALCAAYALDLKKQSETLRGGFTYFEPSRLFLYYNTRERNGHDSGASIRDTIKALNHTGVCKESEWPYVIDKLTIKPPQSCYDDAKDNTLCQYKRLEQDIDQFRACLKDNCPIAFGFRVFGSFHKMKNGVMPMPTTQEVPDSAVEMHAVVAVGYDDTKKAIKVLNSWGSDWEDNGYFYMPYDFIKNDEYCFDFWKITFSCQRGKPRPKNTVQCTSGDSEGASGIGGLSYGASGYSYSGASKYGYNRSGRGW